MEKKRLGPSLHKHHDFVIMLIIFALFFVAFNVLNKDVDLRLIIFDAATDIIILVCIAEVWMHLAHLEVKIYQEELEIQELAEKEEALEKREDKLEEKEKELEKEEKELEKKVEKK